MAAKELRSMVFLQAIPKSSNTSISRNTSGSTAPDLGKF